MSERETRPVISHDDSGSMLLALFAILILTSLVSVVLMATISQQAKTRKATDFTFAGQAVDTAVNDALLTANKNNQTAGHDDNVASWKNPALSRGGVAGEFMWTWYATDAGTDTNPAWKITATGCRNKNAKTGNPAACSPRSTRTVSATLTAAVVNFNDTPGSGEVAYILNPQRGFGRALFADEELLLHGPATVGSYPNPGFGQVGTNGRATFASPAATVAGIYMSNTQDGSSAGQCLGPQCSPVLTPRLIHDIRPRLLISDTTFIDDKILDDCTMPLKAWVASDPASGGVLVPGVQCYSSMTFDINTTVTGMPGNETEIYVNGSITVAAGVTVNAIAAAPDTSILQIYSTGTVVSIEALSTSSKVAWNLWAPKAVCSTNAAPASITLYGSMVCRKIVTQGGFFAMWDERLRTTASELAGLKGVWEITGYEDKATTTP